MSLGFIYFILLYFYFLISFQKNSTTEFGRKSEEKIQDGRSRIEDNIEVGISIILLLPH